MSEEYVIVNKSTLTSIADEVRNIDGSSNSFFPTQIAPTLSNVNSSIGAALLALTGNKTSTLSVNVADGQYYHYRAKMTDVDGRIAYSDAAMLSVAGYIAITKQPTDIISKSGNAITLHVAAQGDGLSYQWQYKLPGNTDFQNATSADAKAADWTFSPSAPHSGRIYRCRITDAHGNSVTTNEILLTVGAIGITKQPVDVVGAVNDIVTLSTKAVGDGLGYQWQRSENKGATWLNCTSAGAKTADWTFTMYAGYDGLQYRCVITDSSGNTVTTNEIKLWIASKVNITSQPQSVKANIGDTVNFTIRADNVVTYQWQVSTDSGITWQNVSLADEKYTVNSSNTVHDMAGMIEDLTAGSGNSELAKQMIDRSITEIEDSSITQIGDYAFAGCPNLSSISFPACVSIGNNAFMECSSLISVNFPMCTSIGKSVFKQCSNLISVSFPACTTISTQTFYGCNSLTTINFPECTIIGNYAFAYCSNFTFASFPKCITIGSYAFLSCPTLTSINFPVCTTIGKGAFDSTAKFSSINFPACTTIESNAFMSCNSLIFANFPACIAIGDGAFEKCTKLTSVNFPMCSTIGFYAFRSCYSLTSINFPKCIKINNYAFYSCRNLTTLILEYPSVVTLGTEVFNRTPMSTSSYTGTYGSIYVPASLVSAYQSATNWSIYSARITSITT